MRVSIAMAAYNGARYIQAQLDSFVAQTRLPDELVVSDDGSTDETLAILQTFQQTAPFDVRIIRNSKRLGVRGNFSKALEACRGDYVFLSDQDDVWFETKIEAMLSARSQRPEAHLAICDARLANHDLTELRETKLEHARRTQLNPKARHLMGCCMMMTREFAHLATPIPTIPENHDDWLFLLATLMDGLLMFERPLQFSRRHGDNESRHPLATPTQGPYAKLLEQRTGGDVRQVYESRRLMSAAAYHRLKDHPEELAELAGRDRVAVILELAQERLVIAERRERLLAKNRVARLPATVQTLARGEYRHFAGWRSALADLIAATSRTP